MFKKLREKVDRLLVAAKEGSAYLKFVDEMRALIREEEKIGTARAVLETVFDAREYWGDTKGFATRVSIETNFPSFPMYSTPAFDDWEVALRSTFDAFQATILDVLATFESLRESSLDHGNANAVTALRRAHRTVAEASGEFTLDQYVKTRSASSPSTPDS